MTQIKCCLPVRSESAVPLTDSPRRADYLAQKGVSVVAAAHLGRGFTTALDAKGIRHAESAGSIDEVAKKLGVGFGAA